MIQLVFCVFVIRVALSVWFVLFYHFWSLQVQYVVKWVITVLHEIYLFQWKPWLPFKCLLHNSFIRTVNNWFVSIPTLSDGFCKVIKSGSKFISCNMKVMNFHSSVTESEYFLHLTYNSVFMFWNFHHWWHFIRLVKLPQ